jgi:chloramphenicol 3-O-phosphotransferase
VNEDSCRGLLLDAVERVACGRALSPLLRRPLGVRRARELLTPIVRHEGRIEWLGVNRNRVDVGMVARDHEWRVVFGTRDRRRIDWIDVFERPPISGGVSGGRAVVVNGPSGAGKSTLLRNLQAEAQGPLVIFDEPEHVGAVDARFLIWRDRSPTLHRGFLEAIAALARAGNCVAVSAGGRPQSDFASALAGVPTIKIGMFCDRDVLLAREQRTGRWGGIAQASFGVHDGWSYDLTIDTTIGPDVAPLARRTLAMLG